MSEDATKIQVIGDTTPPEGCESAQVRVNRNYQNEPIEIVMGCNDFRFGPREARELARLLTKAAQIAEVRS